MKIIKHLESESANDATYRLISEMLCLEHAARATHVVGSTIEVLPYPHDPYPLINLKTITTQGLPYNVHYRPTVGIVYYTQSKNFNINNLATTVGRELDKFGYKHFQTYRSVAATSTTILRHKGHFNDKTRILGPTQYLNITNSVDIKILPARVILWLPIDNYELRPPPYYSSIAAFTWIFMPVRTAIMINERGFNSMHEVNAIISAILYDDGNICKFANNDIARQIKYESFNIVSVPPCININHHILRDGIFIVNTSEKKLIYACNAVNNYTFQQPNSIIDLDNRVHKLPTEEWKPETLLLQSGKVSLQNGKIILNNVHIQAENRCEAFQCLICKVPLSGINIVIRRKNQVNDFDKGLLLCKFCWNLTSGVEFTNSIQISSINIPFTQAEVAACCTGYEHIAKLLTGIVTPVDNCTGAFLIEIPSKNGPIMSVIITSENLGKYAILTYPKLIHMKIGVISELRIAEIV